MISGRLTRLPKSVIAEDSGRCISEFLSRSGEQAYTCCSTCKAGEEVQYSWNISGAPFVWAVFEIIGQPYGVDIEGCELGQGYHGINPFCSHAAAEAHIQALHHITIMLLSSQVTVDASTQGMSRSAAVTSQKD